MPRAEGPETVDLRLEGAGTIDAFGEEGDDDASGAGRADAAAEGSPAPMLTYEPYYGLDEKAFSLSPDPRFLYRSASHAPVLRDLVSAIGRREGLIVLTGDIGTGKTTLCRAVIEQLDRKTFTTFVPDPFVTREDLLKTMLIDFGVMSVDDLVKGRLKGASRPDLSFPLYEFLQSLEPLEAFAVLVIDEVQNLSLPLLEEIRILSDLESGRKLLQVVLVGQPEFDDILRLPRMRQIHQRVSVHCQLQPLDRENVTGYVSHRLRTAGATAERVSLLPEALDVVHAASGGVPRIINLLCDKALAHGQARRATRIGAELVRLAMIDLRMAVPEDARPATPPAVAAVTVEPVAPNPVVANPVTVPPAPVVPASVPQEPVRRAGTWASDARHSAPADDLLALLDLPATAIDEEETLDAAASRLRPASASALARGKVWLGTRNLRPAAAAALMVLGLTTGVSLVSYWIWVRPAWMSPLELPSVLRPVRAQAGVGPLVLRPGMPQLNRGAATGELRGIAESSRRVTTAAASDLTWAIQAASFLDPARAASAVATLEALNYPAFERDVEFSGGGRWRVVFVGPYGTREAAAAVLNGLRRIPDFEGALARPLAP
jgi:type II secretory pathway predicted ATPase ExeA/cell division septation protein DedD